MLRPGEFPVSTIEKVARAALGNEDAIVGVASTQLVEYDAYLPGRFVYRVSGSAVVRGKTREWSSIVKWTDSPSVTPRSPHERGSREAAALSSGVLHDLNGLRAPRLYDVSRRDDGSIALWLEDLGSANRRWAIADFTTAAQSVGRFNAEFTGRDLRTFDWLVTDWADRQSEHVDLDGEIEIIEQAARSSAARDALGAGFAHRATRMVRHQPDFKAALASLPQTLCHHDAAKSNLFLLDNGDEPRVVAIDWELVGTGPLGADIATLISGSLRKAEFPAERAYELDIAVLSAYINGLRTEGWTGADSAVRLGLSASLALRYWFIRDALRKLSDQETRVPDRDVLISRYLLDRSDDALSQIS